VPATLLIVVKGRTSAAAGFCQSVPVAWQTHAESLSIEELDQLNQKRE